jgi:predicted DNA binding CopG/RHH family protein
MPNAPKTPIRTLRVSDELWSAVQAKAAEQGITVTSVIIDALEKFIHEELDTE